jgi:hypothetical protein
MTKEHYFLLFSPQQRFIFNLAQRGKTALQYYFGKDDISHSCEKLRDLFEKTSLLSCQEREAGNTLQADLGHESIVEARSA